MKYLFLDDYRSPVDCLTYMYKELGPNNLIYKEGWTIVRSYNEFVKHIEKYGLPEVISFDHDLADAHYTVEDIINYGDMKEKSGMHCAQWLVGYCIGKKLKLPKFIVHSMNPVGKENIEMFLKNYIKYNENE